MDVLTITNIGGFRDDPNVEVPGMTPGGTLWEVGCEHVFGTSLGRGVLSGATPC